MKFKITPLAGDASYRTFYRLVKNNKSKIVILAKKEKYRNLVVYATINKFLRLNKIFAPKVYFQNLNKGILIIEDFGDNSFYKIIKNKKNKLVIYKKLVNLLIKIQKIKLKKNINSPFGGAYKIKNYSKNYLFQESNLFFDWYLPLFLNKKKTKKIKIKAKKILNKIYNKLNFPNAFFVHRDYHAQNLISFGNKIGVIDSQDALIGNPTYDLVSLIDDVRIKTSIKLKNQVYKYYLKKSLKIYQIHSDKFLEDFNILSVQRSLKIIGIFSRLFKRDNKNSYLKYIPYTWQLLEMRLNSGNFLELKKILRDNIPKKIRKKVIFK